MIRKGSIIHSTFDEYKIQKQIGQGGSGSVYLATNSNGDYRAIKFINVLNSNKEKVKRFKNEINFCHSTTHPNIIKVLEYGTYEKNNIKTLYYVMPYYEMNLRTAINNGIPENKVIDIFRNILEGLKYAHKNKIWHRDLKPENIICDSELKNVVIADWGIAHFCEENMITTIETKETTRLANFTYAAPEQRMKQEKVSAEADVYALGLILNEMFTKKVIAGTNYKTISDITEEYSYLDILVEQMIEQEPHNRIYPIDRIFLELTSLCKEYKNNKELEELMNTKITEDTSVDPLFSGVQIEDIKYEDNTLKIFLNKFTNGMWNNILLSGEYSHTSSMNYPTSSFKYDKVNNKTYFYVNIYHESKHTIENIVTCFKQWIETTQNIYKQRILFERQQKYQKEIQEREMQRKKIEKELEINSMLKSLV